MIYIVLAPESGLVKIGKARDVAKRLQSLSTAHPHPLVVLRTCEGSFREERAFHLRFSKRRKRGEWFEYCYEMMTFAPSGDDLIAAAPGQVQKKSNVLKNRVQEHCRWIEEVGIKAICDACRVPESTVFHWKSHGIPRRYWLTISWIGRDNLISNETGADIAFSKTNEPARLTGAMTLSKYLKSNHIRANAFARDLGISPSNLSDWKAGRRLPNAHLLARIERMTNGRVTARDFVPDCETQQAAA